MMKNYLKKINDVLIKIDHQLNFRYIKFLEKNLQDCESILDLGCGYFSPLGLINTKKYFTIGLDIFEKYIVISKRRNIHDRYIIYNILEIEKIFKPKSVDCVILLDVIEHLEKLRALNLLRKIEKIAVKKIIISTPNGFLKQDVYHKNIHQLHKSGWNWKLFKQMDYKVFGKGGLKILKTERGEIRHGPFKIFIIFSTLSEFFMKNIPQLAFQLFCVKKIS